MTMKKLYFIVEFLILYNLCIAQEYKRNANWVFGQNPVVNLNFNSTLTMNALPNINSGIESSSSAISDTNGNLLLFSNGYIAYNYLGDAVDSGEYINCPYGKVLCNYYGGASLFDQTSVILPKKGNTYYVFSTGMSDSVANNYLNHTYTEFDVLNYSLVDMDSNAGKGKVVEKNVVLADKQHYVDCALHAVKHSNGKDWWLVKADAKNNRYQVYLIREDTILGPYYQNVPINKVGGFRPWQSELFFSKDGTKMASTMYGNIDTINGSPFYDFNRVDVFDFDRCYGNLTYKQQYRVPYDTSSYPNYNIKEGICFSPNGKLLYMSNTYTVYQIDLEDTNIYNATFIHGPDTSIAGFGWYASMGVAPNGKLYIGSTIGSYSLSYIDSPNVKGLGCGFMPRGLTQSYTGLKSPPNMPNYGLGADTSVVCWPLQNENVKEKEKDWFVYPNPTYQNIYIKNASGKKKTLYNLSGQIISLTTKDEIDVSKYAKGLYFIQIENAVKKIILE